MSSQDWPYRRPIHLPVKHDPSYVVCVSRLVYNDHQRESYLEATVTIARIAFRFLVFLLEKMKGLWGKIVHTLFVLVALVVVDVGADDNQAVDYDEDYNYEESSIQYWDGYAIFPRRCIV